MPTNATNLEKTSSEKSFCQSEIAAKYNLIAGLFLAAVTLLVYNPVVHFDFINFDDDRYVFNNRHILQGLHWRTIVWAFQSTQEANWHPVTWLSHLLDYQLFGLNPLGHHYTNVLLHICNAVLLFVFLDRTTHCIWRSLMVSSLFAVHPINVESVAWVAERKNVLCTLFFFLTLLFYLKYVRKPSFSRYLLVASLFALGLMAKPMVITLPFVLLLVDYWPLGRMKTQNVHGRAKVNPEWSLEVSEKSWSWLFFEKIPLLVLALGSAFITLVAQSRGGAVSSIEQVSIGSRLGNAIVCYMRYIQKAAIPFHLAPLYPYPQGGPSASSVFWAALFLLGFTIIVFFVLREHYLKSGWLWFLGTLIPVIGLVQIGNQAMADRYAYIPFIGLFIMFVWAVSDWVDQHGIKKMYVSFAALIIIAVMSLITEKQLSYWHDSVSLWSRTIAVTANNFVAEDNLGNALILEGKEEEASLHFQAALRINPADPVGELNVGVYDQKHGYLNESVRLYQDVLRHTTDILLQTQAYADMGSAYRVLGNYSRARQSYESALQMDPNATLAMVGLGLVAQKTGDLGEAIEIYERAATIQPNDVVYLLLSQVYRQKGKLQEANAAFDRAQSLSRNIEKARQSADALIAQ